MLPVIQLHRPRVKGWDSRAYFNSWILWNWHLQAEQTYWKESQFWPPAAAYADNCDQQTPWGPQTSWTLAALILTASTSGQGGRVEMASGVEGSTTAIWDIHKTEAERGHNMPFLECTARPPALLNHCGLWRHCRAPVCCTMGTFASVLWTLYVPHSIKLNLLCCFLSSFAVYFSLLGMVCSQFSFLT